jgi:hypothetical protein
MNIGQFLLLLVVPAIVAGIYIILHHRSAEALVKSECQKIMDVVNPKCEIRDNHMSPEEILRMVNVIWRAEKVNQPIKCMYNDNEINIYVDTLCHNAKEFSGGVFIFDVKFNDISVLRCLEYFPDGCAKKEQVVWFSKKVNRNEIEVILNYLYNKLIEEDHVSFLR